MTKMLSLLLPKDSKIEENQDKVSEANLVLDEGRVVFVGNWRMTKGKANLFQLYDEYPNGDWDFIKNLSTKFGFAFFDKSGKKRLCLKDRGPFKAVENMLYRHKRKMMKKYLYFHGMVTTIHKGEKKIQTHKLSHGFKKKEQYREQLDDIKQIKSQFTFPVREEMLYFFRGLHETPHGLALATDRDESNKRLADRNIPNYICSTKLIKCVDHPDAKVICPGAQELVWFHQKVQLDKKGFLEFIKKYGKGDAVRDDGGNVNRVISKRIYMGFGQIQHATDESQLNLHGPSYWKLKGDGNQEKVPSLDDAIDNDKQKIPTLNIKILEVMPFELKIQLGRILTFGQSCFDSYFQSDKIRPFSNEFRNSLFGNSLQSFFPEQSESSFRWEYVDITIKHYTANLPKHMDYSNDSRVGYDHCGVYSFSVDGFRVSFIMTSRKNCGSRAELLQTEMFSKNIE
jgi:hypothetical protein